MIGAIVGTKIEQTQAFTEDGMRIPVTTVKTGPLSVVSVKTVEKDGYTAIQLGFGKRRIKTLTQPEKGHIKKAGMEENPPRFLREVSFTGEDLSQVTPGTLVKVSDVLAIGDKVIVTGISKGKGFQGGVRRYGFSGGPATHGQSDRERAPGSVGSGTTPGRVYKGKHMAGRMGNDRTAIKGLQVIAIDEENQIITIKGLVPGGRNSLLILTKIVK